MPTVYPFLSFENPTDSTRPRRRRRDVEAVYQVAIWKTENGYEPGEPIYNTPPDPGAKDEGLYHVDVSFVQRGDLLLCAGRPEKDKHEYFARKRILRAWTDLEQHIFDAWDRLLPACPRDVVVLSSEIRKLLPPGFEGRGRIEFKQVGCAYKKLDGQRSKLINDDRTAAYLLYLAELWEGGPGLISCFGMDANATLAFCYRLARDYSKLLERPGFAMVEMKMTPIPYRATNLRWAMDWRLETLIHQVF